MNGEDKLSHLSQLGVEREAALLEDIKSKQKHNTLLKITAFVMTALGVLTIAYALNTYPRVQTITSTSPICNVAGYIEPSDDAINAYLQKVSPKTFSFDFLNYRTTLNELTDRYFNEKGKAEYFKALDDSNNLKSVLDLKLILRAEIYDSPKILQKTKDSSGLIHWQTETPVRISFVDPKKGTSQERLFKLYLDLVQNIITSEKIDGVSINGLVLAPDDSQFKKTVE